MRNTTGLTRLALATITLLLNGCALLEMGTPDEQELYANDPVGQAALAVREPSRQPAEIPTREARSSSLPSRLILGMTPTGVKDLWGQPQDVETAGRPDSGNERWLYLNGLSKSWGTSDYRVVYFEQGHVVGWENHR